LSPAATLAAAVLGNMAVVPPLLALLSGLEALLAKRLEAGGGFLHGLSSTYFKLVTRARIRAKPYVNRYGALGLAVFTAIPLPLTGAWTASLAAHALGMDRRVALLSIWLGVLVAALIVAGLVGLLAGLPSSAP